MILVVGIPCGGTSIAAGILHHLGVDMGDIGPGSEAHVKPYRKFECREMAAITARLGPAPIPEILHDEFKAYIARHPCGGVKNFALNRIALVPELLDDLEFITVHACRDVGDALASDISYRGWDMDRAAAMGRMHMTMRKMLHERPPAAVVDYHRVLYDPVGVTMELARDLGLPWRPAAAEFVNPETKGIVDA